jgi:2-succinyl-6-hydroxy-2,4-cyclohexadiene-1-carboxylate synthase
MKHVIDSIRYNVETYGDGFPVFLLHGFTGDGAMWAPFFEKWGNHSKLFAVDIIGHGKSDSPEEVERYRMLSVVDDLFLLMEKLRIPKADFIGYSMGGRLALSFAVKYPTKVRKLVLESSSPGLEKATERQARIAQDMKLASFIEQEGMEAFVNHWENIPLFETQKKLSEAVRRSLREQRLRNSIIGLTNSLKGMGTGAQPSWWDELETTEVDTLLITGALDNKFCSIAQNMKEKLIHCQWMNVDDAGHAIHMEQPEIFGTIVSRFLSNT